MNFTTKVGLPLSVVYAFTYILFLLQYRKTKYPDRTSQVLAFSYLLTLFAILFYSVFQTGHSGMTYWLVYAIAFAFVFIKGTRMQEPRGPDYEMNLDSLRNAGSAKIGKRRGTAIDIAGKPRCDQSQRMHDDL